MSSDTSQIDEIAALEKQLMADINDFNTKYSCYLHSSNNPNSNVKHITICKTTVNANDVETAKKKVEKDIADIKDKLQRYTGTTQTNYNIKFNDIIKNYNQLSSERNDLDTKLAELYNTDNGISNYYNNKYAATMFSKIMLTIFVTCLVYYTFRKLIKK